MKARRYTADEMRVRADYLDGALADAKTAAMLRQAADMMEREEKRERKCEYVAMFIRKRNGKCIAESASHYMSLEEAKLNNRCHLAGEYIKFARRNVGEWEEVEE